VVEAQLRRPRIGQQVLRAVITDILGIANITDITDVADIVIDIVNITEGLSPIYYCQNSS
jgi:hypothetical protein